MTDLWDDERPPASELGGLYVAISGNTAAGKSSLIRAVTTDRSMMAIQERSLHHPLLRLMFSAPEQFAFPIQLNFVLQRHLALQRHLGLGHCVIIERSHLDDELFIREHAKQGRLRPGELDAWLALWKVLHARLRWPDVLVLMNPPPELSLQRLTHAETTGQRPREFPDEPAKKAWVYRWHRAYEAFHDRIRKAVGSGTSIVDIHPSWTTQAAAARVQVAIERHPRFEARWKPQDESGGETQEAPPNLQLDVLEGATAADLPLRENHA